MSSLLDIMKSTPVIPVLAFTSAAEAIDVCGALYESGLKVLEITLRHATALDAIAAVAASVPEDAIVGAGTVTTPTLAAEAKDAGAVFGVSPGLTEKIADAVKDLSWAFLPGVATLSEAIKAREMGFTELKFFPASVAGGPAFLKAVHSVLPDLSFCPTGGVTAANMADYKAVPNVVTVGGSWITPRGPEGTIDLDTVRKLAAEVI